MNLMYSNRNFIEIGQFHDANHLFNVFTKY